MGTEDFRFSVFELRLGRTSMPAPRVLDKALGCDSIAPPGRSPGALLLSAACALFVFVAVARTSAASPPSSQPASPPSSQPASAPAPLPQTPGEHRLFHPAARDGQPWGMPYIVRLPKDYRADRGHWPLVLFLSGGGERGEDHDALYTHGPLTAMQGDAKLAAWAPFVVLAPQCPHGREWQSEDVARAVLDLTRFALDTWRIDRDRVCVTGLSMGGRGCWQMILDGGGLFAAAAVVSAGEVAPDRMGPAARGMTVWIITGAEDGGYVTGSREMAKRLREAGVDVIHTNVPEREHIVWMPFYASRAFYEFLLLHRRRAPAPASRPAPEALLAIAYAPPPTADARLVEPLKQFLPWWQVVNCLDDMDPGLREEWGGRRNVFVTHPLSRRTACVLMTRQPLPADQHSALRLTVGHHPEGDWDLIVRADKKELLRRTVGREAAKDGWLEVEVDLSEYNGREVFLELENRATGWNCEAGYWGKVELVHRTVGEGE